MNNIEKLLNYKSKNKIGDFCIRISENIGKVEAKFTLDMITGLLASGNTLLSSIGRNLKEGISLKQTEKRLSYNLSNFKKQYIHEIRDNLLVSIKNQINSETVISLDGGDINKEGAKKMQGLYKVYDGSKKQIVSGYNLNSIVATNVIKDGSIQNIPLNLSLYSTQAVEYESENRESVRSIDEVIKIIGNVGIWTLDRGYDRARNIIKELLDRNLKFIIRGIGTRNLCREKFGKENKKYSMKKLADLIKTRKRITYFEYKDTVRGKEKQGFSGRVGYEKVKVVGSNGTDYGIEEELTLCVLKRLNGEISMMILTNIEVKNNEDVLKIFSKYSCRWGVEDTYKYIKQEYGLEGIQLRNYKSLQNMMIFVLSSMHFVSNLRSNEKYFCKTIIKYAKILNLKLKYLEHSIISGLRFIIGLSSVGIRDFLRKKINRSTGGLNMTLFDDIENPYKILGKL